MLLLLTLLPLMAMTGNLLHKASVKKRWLNSDTDAVVLMVMVMVMVMLMVMLMVMVVTGLLLHRAQRDDLAGCTECVSTGCTPSWPTSLRFCGLSFYFTFIFLSRISNIHPVDLPHWGFVPCLFFLSLSFCQEFSIYTLLTYLTEIYMRHESFWPLSLFLAGGWNWQGYCHGRVLCQHRTQPSGSLIVSALSIKSKLQEYIKSRVGSTVFQRYFADWAGHNCANMDYLTREQVRKISDQFCKKKQFCGTNHISTSADCWRSPWLGIGPCSDRLCGKESTRWDFVSFV